VADDGDEVAPLLAVVAGEIASEHRSRPNYLKKIGGDEIAFECSGAGFIAQVEVVKAECGDITERPHLCANAKIVGWGSAILAGMIGIGFAQQHQTIELRKRIWPKEKRIDCAEDGRVRADAERKRQNCSQCETWCAD
jgi:hypothetical protein